MIKFSNYVLWINLQSNNEKIIMSGLREIYDSMMDMFYITPERSFDFEDMFLHVGKNFYLIRVAEGWSPGDISGMFKHKYLDKDEEVMAIQVSRDRYLPYHGLINIAHEQLHEWDVFPDKFHLIYK